MKELQRHHRSRMLNKRLKQIKSSYGQRQDITDEEILRDARLLVNHHTECSRPCCNNSRKYFGDTMGEIKSSLSFKEQMRSIQVEY